MGLTFRFTYHTQYGYDHYLVQHCVEYPTLYREVVTSPSTDAPKVRYFLEGEGIGTYATAAAALAPLGVEAANAAE